MEPYLTISIVLIALISALHIVGAVLEIFFPLSSKILGYVNLGLHIPFILMLLLAESEYEVVAISLVGTALVYTLAHLVSATVSVARGKKREEAADE